MIKKDRGLYRLLFIKGILYVHQNVKKIVGLSDIPYFKKSLIFVKPEKIQSKFLC